MRTLVVYYSFTGNNRLLAGEIAGRLNADMAEVVEEKKRTMPTILLDMLFRRTPRIKPLGHPVSDYDHVVLVAPIWNAAIAHPMQALIKREKDSLPKFSFITLCGSGKDNQQQVITRQLSSMTGRTAEAVRQLKVSELLPEPERGAVKAVSGHRVTRKELLKFDSSVREFCQRVQPG